MHFQFKDNMIESRAFFNWCFVKDLANMDSFFYCIETQWKRKLSRSKWSETKYKCLPMNRKYIDSIYMTVCLVMTQRNRHGLLGSQWREWTRGMTFHLQFWDNKCTYKCFIRFSWQKLSNETKTTKLRKGDLQTFDTSLSSAKSSENRIPRFQKQYQWDWRWIIKNAIVLALLKVHLLCRRSFSLSLFSVINNFTSVMQVCSL